MRANLLFGLIAVLWIGMILAVGMESVVKFDTQSLSSAVAFDEGRVIFHFFNKIQFILMASMLMLAFIGEISLTEYLIFFFVSLVLVTQAFWLFPILNHHVDLILQGVSSSSNFDHTLYGWLELAKMSLLSLLAFRLLIQFGK